MRVRIGNSSVGGRVNIKSRLPAGYQEVEYIENTGYSVLNTGILPDKKKFIIDMQYTSNASRQLLGIGPSSSEYFGNNNGTWEKIGNSDNVGTLERVVIHYDVGQIAAQRTTTWIQGSVNRYYGYAANGATWDSEVAKTFKMFDLTNTGGGYYSKAKLYKFTVIDAAGDIVNQLIPCVRLSDNKPGMYDIVNNNFLVNNGTGEFVVGPNVPKSVLPDEYQRVEYVEGTGTQYIDTGVNGNNINLKIYTKYCSNSAGNLAIFSARTSSSNGISFWVDGWCQFGAVSAKISGVKNDTNIHEVILSKDGLWFDNNKLSLTTGTTMANSNLVIYRVLGDSRTFVGKIYSFKVWDSVSLVRDFIPCYRKSDGVIGMYDVITKQFFTNQGTGTFLKGSNVVNNIGCKPHITIEGTTNLFPSQYQNGYYISEDSSSTLTASGQFSVSHTVQGKYTLSGYYKIASTDSAVSPRITLRADYSDGTTAVLKQDWDIKKDDAWHHFIITGETNANKILTRLYGWIFDYRTPGSARNFACKCVQLENKDHATLYTPTSRSDNTII